MVTAYLKRNLSWLSVPFNGVMRSYVDDGERTETASGRLYWRYEDEPTMAPQFWRDGVVGFESAGPLNTGGRDVRLYIIGRTITGTPTDKDFILAEQKVVDMSATTGVECIFDHITDKTTTGTSEETLYIDQIDAGKLAVNGDKVDFKYAFTIANPSNDKFIKLTWESTTIITHEITDDTGDGLITGWIQRVSASKIRHSVQLQTATTRYLPDYAEITGLDLDGTDYDLKLKATTADAAGDITAKLAYGVFIPAASTNTNWWLDENGEPWLDEDGDQYEE